LPDFIQNTGITELRGTVAEDEDGQNAKQKNRSRVAPKMGAIDVDYRTLHDAFFKHQTKPKSLTQFGDVYYEGKELEVKTDIKPGGPLSNALREALGMASESSPPPWLLNMQRYGPPPSCASLKIPGLNAPLPNSDCQYGYHPGGWGKPPLDQYGRPLYGGNPFDPPGSSGGRELDGNGLVTSDGKTVAKAEWGSLPTGYLEADEESEEEESSDEEMDESEEEAEEGEEGAGDGIESILPPPSSTAPVDLRKQPGDETPLDFAPAKQLYQVIDQTKASADQQAGAVFTSDVAYVVPGTGAAATAATVPEGAESVLSKALPGNESGKRTRKANDDEDDEEDLGKNFKF
jgi:splicing factor 3B subunit 2